MSLSIQTVYGILDETQLRDLKNAIDEATTIMFHIEQKQKNLKDIIDAASDGSSIPKKIVKKMAKVKYKQSFQEEIAEYKEFEALFEGITEIK